MSVWYWRLYLLLLFVFKQSFTFSVNTIHGTSSEVTPRSEVLTRNDDTRSQNLLRIDNKLHSSTIAVLGNDDLLIEILLRLPVLSLHLFKSVSKHWCSLITSPSFILSRKNIPKIDPPAGLFIKRRTYDGKMYQDKYDFESFDIRIPSKRSVVFTAVSNALPFFHVLQSCNGLLLCFIEPDKIYVCNPTINLFKILPTNSPDLKLAFDPTKSPHYKVIHTKVVEDDGVDFGYYQIETYSSETGNWSLCGDRFPEHPFRKFHNAIYWNDAFHWLITNNYYVGDDELVVCSHCNLKIVNEHLVLTTTELPRALDGKLLESGCNLLLLSVEDNDNRGFNVFEMKNGFSEWSMKYNVHINEYLPSSTWWMYECVCAIISGEREEDSYIIIDFSTKVVQYNPMLKTLRTLYDLESQSFLESEAYQFIPSFAGV